MGRETHTPLIEAPEKELHKVFVARIAPFVELGNSAKVGQYENAWKIARTFLRKARERKDSHAD